MATPTLLDPVSVHCSDWKKIDKSYRLSDPPQKCSLCGSPAPTKCAGCLRVAYCSADHQKKHWRKEHRLRCSLFKIDHDDKVGRYVVATRDIKAGEIIIEEQPVTAGPKQFTPAVCLGCFDPVDGSYVCSGCGWPMCGSECEKRSKLHGVECAVLAKCKFKPQMRDEYGQQGRRRNI
jgi:hypothetical protein